MSRPALVSRWLWPAMQLPEDVEGRRRAWKFAHVLLNTGDEHLVVLISRNPTDYVEWLCVVQVRS